MNELKVIPKVSGPYNLITYYLVCAETRHTIIIDPGGTVEQLSEFIRQQKLIPEMVLMTHGHADPFFSMADFKRIFPVPYAIHADDDRFFKDPEVRRKTKQMVNLPPPYPADKILMDSNEIVFGRQKLTVIHTPGHTPGSVCYWCQNRLFTGDAIFVGEAGRVDLPGGDIELLVESIRIKIMALDPATIIHPGHYHTGDPMESTLEKEMKSNIYITDFILEDSSE